MRLSALALLVGCLAIAPPDLVAQAAAPSAPLPSVVLPPELDRVLKDYERAWQAGDKAALAALFVPDGIVSSRQGWVRGTAAIQAAYAYASGPLRLRAVAFAVSDSVGYIVGGFRYGDGPGPPDSGRFVLALRRTPGGPWLIATDLDAGP